MRTIAIRCESLDEAVNDKQRYCVKYARTKNNEAIEYGVDYEYFDTEKEADEYVKEYNSQFWYEIAFEENNVGDEDNSVITLDDLKKTTLEIAIENNFELVDSEGWIKFFNHGELINDGYSFKSFKDDLSEDTIFALCTEILAVLGIEVYRLLDDNKKVKIDFLATIPNSEDDDDQILYQMGLCNDVCRFSIFENNKFVGFYGSYLCGEQNVRAYRGYENGKWEFVEVGGGEEERIIDNPQLLKELHKKQREEAKEYLYYDLNCWLEHYFQLQDGTNLAVYSRDKLQIEAEVVHSSIAEGFNISTDTIDEMTKAVKTIKDLSISEEESA